MEYRAKTRVGWNRLSRGEYRFLPVTVPFQDRIGVDRRCRHDGLNKMAAINAMLE